MPAHDVGTVTGHRPIQPVQPVDGEGKSAYASTPSSGSKGIPRGCTAIPHQPSPFPRGCFSFVHVADPKNGIYESNENNNEGERVVRLPYQGPGLRGCPGESRSGGPDGGAEAPGSNRPYGY